MLMDQFQFVFVNSLVNCIVGFVPRKKELICADKHFTFVLFGGLALSMFMSGCFKGLGYDVTGVFMTGAILFNGWGSVVFLIMLYRYIKYY